jgi:hypothetical protein
LLETAARFFCFKPPSPTLPPKGEGSLSILSYKKLKLFHKVQKAKNGKTSNFPLGGLRGLWKMIPTFKPLNF